MFTPSSAKRNILVALITAEESGTPVKLDSALKKWGNGSAWESVADCGYVNRYPEAVTVTASGKEWLEKTFPGSPEIPTFNRYSDDLGSCKWDRMSTWEKRWTYVFVISIVLWGAPVFGSMIGKDLFWIMPFAGTLAAVSGLLSGMISMILESFEKK